jgi:hypothetical protein
MTNVLKKIVALLEEMTTEEEFSVVSSNDKVKKILEELKMKTMEEEVKVEEVKVEEVKVEEVKVEEVKVEEVKAVDAVAVKAVEEVAVKISKEDLKQTIQKYMKQEGVVDAEGMSDIVLSKIYQELHDYVVKSFVEKVTDNIINYPNYPIFYELSSAIYTDSRPKIYNNIRAGYDVDLLARDSFLKTRMINRNTQYFIVKINKSELTNEILDKIYHDNALLCLINEECTTPIKKHI